VKTTLIFIEILHAMRVW